MPRDLLADQAALQQMPTLSRESAVDTATAPADPAEPASPSALQPAAMPGYKSTALIDTRFKKMQDIHPFVSLLNQDDLDDCDWLEHAAFDPDEAATREKSFRNPLFHTFCSHHQVSTTYQKQLEYRLRTCGELCSGIFSSTYVTNTGVLGEILKMRTFPSIDSADSDRKRILLGHVIATKSHGRVVSDDAMKYPADFRTNYSLNPSIGHTEDGRTVCIHSLCVHPSVQDKGLGQILLKSYTQRIKDAGIATRIALICRDRYIKFYQRAGFKKVGPSKVQYAGGGWVDMVMELGDREKE